MLSARGLFQEIVGHDESYRLFCSIAASGEAQGGWENGRIAALVPESQRALAPKVARHGADEDKHGRIFRALLRKRGLEETEVPEATDYTLLLERRGIGLAHDKLRRDEPLTERDIVLYLAHSRVTEQRAAAQMGMLKAHFGDHPELGRAIRMIAQDEENHLAYCHEELLRLSAQGHGPLIRGALRESALVEIEVYRDVSLAVMERMGRILGWSRAKSAVLAAGIRAMYVYERLGGWRRLVTLRMPQRRDALGGPATSAAEFA
ncbi:ferritin-like domain-containing protein [Streptomyces sp. MST-110588]|uniref:ferritin-like domain-containing protein n=1 Tax=Streptomyces sp. MST-110588 TaxID=2833628 RepID=UPI001F5CE633|nr:ferritin-like domain-containing protein [Streptomyces sp. MST-110588]UNO39165.1 ferritin-like domain-containing protein [Streptomyces sp. MST-110588]